MINLLAAGGELFYITHTNVPVTPEDILITVILLIGSISVGIFMSRKPR